jgi:capsular exopolysaccharide synthesis family protein
MQPRFDAIDPHLVTLLYPTSPEADQYRILRDAIEQQRATRRLTIVAVTSAGVSEGKTTTAINLAGALALDASTRVLLIDADLRNSSVASRLALTNPDGRGLTDVILDPRVRLERVVRRLARFNLDVIDSGAGCSTPYEVLGLPRVGELFEEARSHYDSIIVDVPPAIPFPDCRVMSRWIDGFLLVVAAHRTSRSAFAEAVGSLEPGRVAAVVFNGDNRPLRTKYYDRTGGRGSEDDGWLGTARRLAGGVAPGGRRR